MSLASIIIPTRNRPQRLEKAVKSVLAQTYDQVEVIVINDSGCDVDGILSAMGDSRIRSYRTPGTVERCRARNIGIELSKGEFIGYLDDDDFLYPNHVFTCLQGLEKSDVVYCAANKVTEEKVDGQWFVTGKEKAYGDPFDSQRLLLENYIPIMSLMHRAQCLETVSPFDPYVHRTEDWDFWIRLSQDFTFTYIDTITCEFSWRDLETSMSGPETHFAWAALNMFYKYRGISGTPPVLEKHKTIVVGAFAILGEALSKWEGTPDDCAREVFSMRSMDYVHERAGWLLWQYPEYRKGFQHLLAAMEKVCDANALAESRIRAYPVL